MAKLHFRYGCVGSAKTLNLLAVAHNYRSQGKSVYIIKPSIDTRFGVDIVASRAGLSAQADFVLDDDDSILQAEEWETKAISCILVDECQFISTYNIDGLRTISAYLDIPVICYGLRTNFKGELFPASKRLFELADEITELKTVCTYCERKAVMNLKFVDGDVCLDGDDIELGCEELYKPVCSTCYFYKT